MTFTFQHVQTRRQIREFHKLPFRIHEPDSPWIPPFKPEIEALFHPSSNPFFQHGTVERYLVYTENDVVARFAVMNHTVKDAVYSPKMGGIGFIEMVNDPSVANAVIDFARSWHRSRGYTAFRGPINAAENDTYWGLLIQNFDAPPIYGMYYHPPYYRTLLEATGAEKLDDHYSYRRDFDQPIPERMQRIADRVESRAGVHIRPIDTAHLERDAEFIRHVYNAAWAEQDIESREQQFTELTKDTVRRMLKKMKPVMIPEAVVLTFVDGEPASFVVCIPDLNEVSDRTGGNLRWWHYPRLLRLPKKATRLRTIAYGTLPKYRKMGIEAYSFVRGIEMTRQAAPTLEYLEGAWVSEKNWLMQRSLEALGCRHHKTHRTYHWSVDEI
ncbi:MAG: hypothetical protein ACNA78_03740 [Balneolaceae bacterium]